MGKAFLTAVVGFGVAILVAVASLEVSSVQPTLSNRLMLAAIVLCAAVAALLVLVWRRDSASIAHAQAAEAGTLPAERTLPFEQDEAAPERSPYPYVDPARDTFGGGVVISAAPAASWLEAPRPEVELTGHTRPVLDFAPAPATARTRRPILDRIRRAQTTRTSQPDDQRGEVVVEAMHLEFTRLDPTAHDVPAASHEHELLGGLMPPADTQARRAGRDQPMAPATGPAGSSAFTSAAFSRWRRSE